MTPDQPEALRVLLRFVDELDRLGVAYHVGGSYASSIHGRPRQTQDIDFVVEIDEERATAMIATLHDAFYGDAASAREAVARRESFNLIHLESGIKIDCFVRGDGPFDRAEFERGRPEALDPASGRKVFVKSPEDTILRKLHWYRVGGDVSDRQWLDVRGIVEEQAPNLDRVYLERWGHELGLSDLLDRLFGNA
jgi:hypothetical protein